MRFALIFPIYLLWHYTIAIKDLHRLFKNTIWFLYHFFSIKVLLKTLFMPFRKLSGREGAQKPSLFELLIINILMRLVGFGVRIITIIAGIVSIIVASLLFSLFFIGWLFLPVLIPGLFLFGIGFLI